MKSRNKVILGYVAAAAAALTVESTSALAAGRVGNGGGAIVCRDKETGKILSAEFYDLYEARHQRGMNIPTLDTPVEEQAETAILRFPGSIYEGFQFKDLKRVQQIKRPLLPGDELVLVDDTRMIIRKRGCTYEQLANYTEEGILYYDSEIYSYLSNTDKAAFDVHETIYAALRLWENAKDSKRARQITAALFSDQNLDDHFPGSSLSSAFLACGTDYEASKKAGIENPGDIEFIVFSIATAQFPDRVLAVFADIGFQKGFFAESVELPFAIFATTPKDLDRIFADRWGQESSRCIPNRSNKCGVPHIQWRGETQSNLTGGQPVIFHNAIEDRFLRKDRNQLEVWLPRQNTSAKVKCEPFTHRMQ